MLRSTKRIIAFILSLLAVVSCLNACSSYGETMMELGDNKITVNMFQLYLSRLKGMMCASNADAERDEFWDVVMSTDGTTYNDYYTDMILDDVKTYLAALYVFDERGLELPDSYIDAVDAELEDLMSYEAEGSKSKFNAILADFGANYKILREVNIIEKKIEYLKDDIFGANGEKISSNLIDDYYNQNYVRFKQIFLYTMDYVYETDGDGEDIYYKSNGRVAYDTSAILKLDVDGSPKLDKNGDKIYIDENSKIAYDKENGERKIVIENGKEKVESFTGAKLQKVKDEIALIYEKVVDGDYSGFDALVEKYSLDEGMTKYPSGYYLTESTNYPIAEVSKKVLEIKAGESAIVTSDSGIHIVMRYELEENGYNRTENADFFISNTTGNYVFMDALKYKLLSDYLQQYKSMIVLDEDAFAKADIKSVGVNYRY